MTLYGNKAVYFTSVNTEQIISILLFSKTKIFIDNFIFLIYLMRNIFIIKLIIAY